MQLRSAIGDGYGIVERFCHNFGSGTTDYEHEVQACPSVDGKKVVFNSDWLGKMTPYDIAELASKQTVARVLERDDFQNRLKSGQDISFLEFLTEEEELAFLVEKVQKQTELIKNDKTLVATPIEDLPGKS